MSGAKRIAEVPPASCRDDARILPEWDGRVQIAAFSGVSRAELLSSFEAFPVESPWEDLRAYCARTRLDFDGEMPYRLAVALERGRTDLVRVTAAIRAGLEAGKENAVVLAEGAYCGSDVAPGALAVLFPGQGTQRPGMFRELCRLPEMRAALAEADAIFAEEDAGDRAVRLSERIHPHPASGAAAETAHSAALRPTQVAQPALAAVGLGAFGALESFGVACDMAAGHSFGEVTALGAAGVLTRRDGIFAARERGRLMGDVRAGASGMLAVRAGAAVVEAVLREESLALTVADNNAPDQVVLAGAAEDIEKAAGALRRRGFVVSRLNVAVAFHSRFVAAARAPFLACLRAIPFSPGRVPVYSNITSAPYPAAAEAARELLAWQLAKPVEFVRMIEAMYAAGARTFLEIGPGAVLTGFTEAILEGLPHHAFSMDASSGKRSGLFDLAAALARLAALGYRVAVSRWDPLPERR